MFAKALGIAGAKAILNPHVEAVGPAQLLQPLQERSDAGHGFRIVRSCAHEHRDATHSLARLCARRHRPHRRAAEQRDERAALHSITSSARASSVGGTSTPSARAVGRLMTNSNLLDCTTGRSAGLAPLRILPV